MLDEGVWADVKAGEEHLRLFSEDSAQGVQMSVFNAITKTWIAPSETVDSVAQGKEKAEACARLYLQTLHLEMPPPVWKKARSV